VTDAVSFHDVRFGWKPSRPVICIPSFSVTRGEQVLLRGPSGSGKSTVLGLIAGVLEPQAGRIAVMGQDLAAIGRSRRDRFRADHIGFVFQMFNLIPYLSVLENVCLPALFSRRRRQAALEEGPLDAVARRLLAALGLNQEELLRRGAAELSHGQQQRVAAARALFGRPEVLIADEPTSALDADARERFLELLLNQCSASGATLIFVSHDASLARLFGRSVEMAEINLSPLADRSAA
jgi:putative ABC transport system ATP-binding protein